MADSWKHEDLQLVRFTHDTVTDEQVEQVVDLFVERRREFQPDDPMPAREDMASRLRVPDFAGMDSAYVGAVVGGDTIGYGGWDLAYDDNPDRLWLSAYVRSDSRRRGVGARILEHMLADTGRHTPGIACFCVSGHVAAGQEIQSFVEREWGLEVKYVERIGRQSLGEVDRNAISDRHEERMAGLSDRYRGVFFELDELPAPETGFDLEDFAQMVENVWNLMPLEDLGEEPETYNVEKFQSMVERQRSRGRTWWNYVMLERETGKSVGLTNVFFNPADPRMIDQGDTGVLESAQRQGIGKALKLWMLRKMLDELPDAQYVYTENANSNEAMIAVNTALGFREHYTANCYEMPTDQLRAIAAESSQRTTRG